MLKNRYLFILTAVAGLATSCGDTAPVEQVEQTASATERLVFGGDGEDRTNVLFTMPTPNELFELIHEMHTAVDKDALFDVSLATSTTDSLQIAYRFGICATDLVYASYFDMTSEVVRYYLTAKELSKEIGVDKAFDRIDVRRLERNLSRGDSLTILTNEAYLEAYKHLDRDQQGDVLAMVLAGGWVETTHLLIEQIGEFDPGNELVGRLAEQQYGLTQVIDLMEYNDHSAQVSDLKDKLVGVQKIFDRMESKESGGPIEEANGRQLLGGEQSFDMGPIKFNELERAITTLRGGVRHNF
jgi:hypothetical protein